MKYLVCIFLFMLEFCNLSAQDARFRTNLLESLAEKIQFSPRAELKNMIVEVGVLHNQSLYANIDNKGVVTHIGYRLFPDELKCKDKGVLEFIERYFLELSFCSDDYQRNQKMQDDKFIFLLGDYSRCFSLIQESDFKLSKVDDKYYEATWSKNGVDKLSVAFPIWCELLTGMPLNEIQKSLFQSVKDSPDSLQLVEELTDMMKIEDGIYGTNPAKHYKLAELINRRYYSMNDSLEFSVIYDTCHLKYSIANLFHLPNLGLGRKLQIEQFLYGFKSITFTVDVSEWVNYCLNEDMNIYFAVENETIESIKAVILVENKNWGYNHLLSVTVPRDFISNPDVKLTATLNAFIPTHNVRNLYQEYTDKKKQQ